MIAFVTLRTVRLALNIVKNAQDKGLEVDRVSHILISFVVKLRSRPLVPRTSYVDPSKS